MTELVRLAVQVCMGSSVTPQVATFPQLAKDEAAVAATSQRRVSAHD